MLAGMLKLVDRLGSGSSVHYARKGSSPFPGILFQISCKGLERVMYYLDAKRIADQLRQRAEQAEKRAEQERQRAEQAEQRAEQERQRAEQAERLLEQAKKNKS